MQSTIHVLGSIALALLTFSNCVASAPPPPPSALQLSPLATEYTCTDKFTHGGFTFDLSPLSTTPFNISTLTETPPTKTRSDLLVNLCKPYLKPDTLPSEDFCTADTWICEVVTNVKESANPVERVVQAKAWVKASTASPPLTVLEGGKGLNVVLGGAESGGLKANVTLLCDEKENPGAPVLKPALEDTRVLQIELKSVVACGKRGPSGVKEGGREGMSAFGIISLLFWISFICYWVLGTAYNYTVNRISHFPDMLPNWPFWKESIGKVISFFQSRDYIRI
ncbi:hypothetical protein HDV05_001258 [Chytridiales sp. JEL 0842]|nr:hypothetical protein HDV05_001258 [Chytridiales sp. JEL 0842]